MMCVHLVASALVMLRDWVLPDCDGNKVVVSGGKRKNNREIWTLQVLVRLFSVCVCVGGGGGCCACLLAN